jgi:hypothetical protein
MRKSAAATAAGRPNQTRRPLLSRRKSDERALRTWMGAGWEIMIDGFDDE